MIYLLDQKLTDTSHSKLIIDIIKKHTDTSITLIEFPNNPTFGEIYKIVYGLFKIVLPSDIVICPWAVDGNIDIDELFNELSNLCWVVVAAGNYNKSIDSYSPSRAENVITVACLNKSGLKATLSNWSDTKDLVWIVGTNYNLGWINTSGTSVSAAVYTAFLAESLKKKDSNLLSILIEEYNKNMLGQIQN